MVGPPNLTIVWCCTPDSFAQVEPFVFQLEEANKHVRLQYHLCFPGASSGVSCGIPFDSKGHQPDVRDEAISNRVAKQVTCNSISVIRTIIVMSLACFWLMQVLPIQRTHALYAQLIFMFSCRWSITYLCQLHPLINPRKSGLRPPHEE